MGSISEAIWSFRLNYFNFQGRTSRKDFWPQFAAYIGIAIATAILPTLAFSLALPFGETIATNTGLVFVFAGMIASLICVIPYLALLVRRLHDTGRSGRWLLLAIPFSVFAFFIFVFWFAEEGLPYPNKYGNAPKPKTKDADKDAIDAF